MLVFIILFCVLAISILLFISSGFCKTKRYYYDEHGENTTYFSETCFKSKKQKECAIAKLKDEFRKANNLAVDANVHNSNLNMMWLPSTAKMRIEWGDYGVDAETVNGALGIFASGLSVLALILCGIPCCINHGHVNQQIYATELTVRADDLRDRQNMICMTLSGDLGIKVQDSGTYYHVVVDAPIEMASSINKYNTDVKCLKQDIYLEKVRSESPWLNWFVNPGFSKVEGYNPKATSYKDILGDTLKTFELTNGN